MDFRKFANDNARLALGLDPDAPDVPKGLRPRVGVEYGCGDPACRDCYEPKPAAPLGSIDNPLR